MRVNYGYLLAGANPARGMAVIIDVFRAFTCTPLMLALGLKKSILVSHPNEALALKNRSRCRDSRNIMIIEGHSCELRSSVLA